MDLKPVPAVLVEAYTAAFSKIPPAQDRLADYLKRLRFYLDFCFKYQHPPRDFDSLPPFLPKWASKNRSKDEPEQASRGIGLYYQTMRNWPAHPAQSTAAGVSPEGWDRIFRQLKEEIRLRQYSPKTLQTYRGWTNQFRVFLDGKPPEDVTADDARRFLTHLATDRHVVCSNA